MLDVPVQAWPLFKDGPTSPRPGVSDFCWSYALGTTRAPPCQPSLQAMTWIDPEDFRRRFGARQLSMAFCQVLSSEEIVGRAEVEVGVDGVLVGVADEGGGRCEALKMKCERYVFVRRKRANELALFVRRWRVVDVLTQTSPQ